MLEPAVLAHVEAVSNSGLIEPDWVARRRVASAEIDEIFDRFGLAGPHIDRVVDFRIPIDGETILVRGYYPPGHDPLPAHVYLHGGGWTTGSIDEKVCDATARHRSVSARCVTFLVEYRLAPEYPFPIAVNDVVAAVRWVRDHASELNVDSRSVILGGSSAGANLAAAAVLADPGLDLRALLLEVPALDLRATSALDLPADVDRSDARWIEPMRDEYRRSVRSYLPDPDLARSPLASPLVAEDVSMFPETFILTAQLDVLRPSAESFANQLRAAGVPVHEVCYPGALHGSPILNATWSTARRWHDDSLAILSHLTRRDHHEPK